MLKKNLRMILRQTFQIGIAAMLLCGFAVAQLSIPNLAEDYYKRGAARMKTGKCSEAIRDFDEAINFNPREAKFFLKRGECFDTLSDLKNAVGDFSRAIELKPDFAEAYIGRGRVYATYYEKDGAIVKNPPGAAALVNPVQTEKALADLNKALEINPRSSDAYLARANFYFSAKEDYDKAVADSATAIKLNPRNASVYELRAGIYSSIGKKEQAIADYTMAIKLEPNNPDLLSSRAQAYRRMGKIRLAETDERKAEKLKASLANQTIKNSVKILFGDSSSKPKTPTEQELLDSYIQYWIVFISRAEEEIKILTKVLEAYPRYVNGLFERGNNYFAVRDYDKAIADYSQAINIAPKDYRLFNNRGNAYAKKGDYDLAIKDFSVAIGLNSGEKTDALYNRGLALFSKGDAEQSVEDFTQVLKVKPKRNKVYRLRAKAYRKLGKIAEAEADETMAKRLEEN